MRQSHLRRVHVVDAQGFRIESGASTLVKLVATLPLLGMQLKMPRCSTGGMKQRRSLAARILSTRTTPTRLRTVPAWRPCCHAPVGDGGLPDGSRVFGTAAGFLALGLMAFDPTVLAHGGVVTTDSAQSCFLLATVYAFYRTGIRPPCGGWSRLARRRAWPLHPSTAHSAGAYACLLAVLELVRRPKAGSEDAGRSIGKRVLRTVGALWR